MNLKIKEFWEWFSKNSIKYSFTNTVDEETKEKMLDELQEQLHKYNEHLYFEIGNTENECTELIITAEGNTDYFGDVEDLVEGAPDIPNWKVIAFKPAMGSSYKINYANKVFDPNEIIFIPYTYPENETVVGIRVCFPDFNENEKDIFKWGTYLTIDNVIGEKSSAKDIDYLEVAQTPEDIDNYNFWYLADLGEYIKLKKKIIK